MIKALTLPDDILLEAQDHVGPVSLLRGKDLERFESLAAVITLRYSDAPKDKECLVTAESGKNKARVSAKAAEESSYLKYRI